MGTSNAQELINNSWSKSDLLGAMFPASNPPTLDSINAHYDHFRSLPADENAANRETILYTTADLAGRSTAGRVIFTMGCHSALPVSDFVLGNPLNADWSQAYAQSGAVVYMGNTGYGLGDTAAVLYSEKLNLLFADRLDGSMTVGQALAFAKQEYAATPTQSGYHLKVIDEATMMGLPMYRVGTGCHGSAADAGDHHHRFGDRAAVRAVHRHAELHARRHGDRQLLHLGRRLRREPPSDRADGEARRHAAGPRGARRAAHRA